MTRHRAIPLELFVVTVALIGGCAGGSSIPSFADAGLDARWIGTCDPDRERPRNGPVFIISECTFDADCLDGVNGRCTTRGAYSVCSYDQCFSDADCGPGLRCACGADQLDGNLCLLDHCSGCGAADCAVSWGCEGHTGASTGGAQNWECYTPDDTCRTDADCDPGEFCTRGPTNRSPEPPDPSWHCTMPTCGP